MYNYYEPKPVPEFVALSVFDKLVEDEDDHEAIIYVYKPPNPSNTLLGLRFIEATADCTLDEVVRFKPSTLSSFNPNERGPDELALVQLTRFTRGSLVLFFSSSHTVADGASASQFVVAWSQACRGLEIHPRTLYDRNILVPRDPPRVAYDHKNVEIMWFIIKAHFTPEFIAKLKSKANSSVPDIDNGEHRPYSTFESLVAHLWRTMARVRGLADLQTTEMKISVNGRSRLKPSVPDEYFGNLILAAFPQSRVKELLDNSLSDTAEVFIKL
ncbi:hypothetical protein C5167_016322 [Papaver somniferum]|nr:hypothetical protein C5167_016322 [Papaver somniferum]